MPASARDKLIRTAHDMFYRAGFHAVGLDAILSEVGVTKTTFYNHFASKDDLVREVLLWHDRWWQDEFRELLRRHGGDSARGQLLALPDVLHHLFRDPNYNGCFFINVAVQFPLPHDPAHEVAAAHKQSMEAIIRELAGFAGAADPKALAQELAIVLEGAYVTEQVTRNPGTAQIARRLVTLVVDRHVPPAKSTSPGSTS